MSVSKAAGSGGTTSRTTPSTHTSSTLTRGSRGAQVASLQRELKAAGINPGPVDGIFGPKTEAAVKQYQAKQRLQVDGKAGTHTWHALHTDGFDPPKSSKTAPAAGTPAKGDPANLTAHFTGTTRAGQLRQMKTGRITINGHTYDFRSGGGGRGNLPAGTYTVKGQSTPGPTMRVGKVGYSFNLSDKYDPRVGDTRSLLRIHPDGGPVGTAGCIGIVGNEATQARFLADIKAQLRASGGSFQLQVG